MALAKRPALQGEATPLAQADPIGHTVELRHRSYVRGKKQPLAKDPEGTLTAELVLPGQI